jgi:uncharacterized membrane protein
MLTARILVLVFALLAIVGLLAGFVRYQALDNDTVRGTAEDLIADEEVRNQIATSLVDELYSHVDVTALLEDALPSDQQRLAGIVATALRELSDRAARGLLARPRGQELWVNSIATTHEQLLRVLDDDVTALSTEEGYVVLNLRPLVVQLGEEVAVFGRVARALPEDAGYIEVMKADELETAQDVTQLLKVLGPIVWAIALLTAAVAIWLASGRRRVIVRSLAVALAAVGLVVLVVIRLLGGRIVERLAETEGVRPAVEDAWAILTGLLADGAWTAIGVGLVALFGIWLTGGTAWATRARRRLAPHLARAEIAYGAGALFLLLIVWWGPTAQTRRWDFLLVAAILLGVGIEALRRGTAREFPEESAPAPQTPPVATG